MEIKRNELLELALMGLDVKIEQKEKSIKIGEKIAETIRESLDGDMERYEINMEKVNRLKRELKELQKYRSDLVWFDEIEELEIV